MSNKMLHLVADLAPTTASGMMLLFALLIFARFFARFFDEVLMEKCESSRSK